MLNYDKDYCCTMLYVGSYNISMRSNFVANGFVLNVVLNVLLSCFLIFIWSITYTCTNYN